MNSSSIPSLWLGFFALWVVGAPLDVCFCQQLSQQTSPSRSSSRNVFATAGVSIGLGVGVMNVDLPDPDVPGEDFGASFRLRLDLAYRLGRWLELGSDFGVNFLGDFDSLNAIFAQDPSEEQAAFTLMNLGVGARLFLPTPWSRFESYAMGAVGTSWLSLTAPNDLSRTRTDFAWSLGGGLQYHLNPRIAFRTEGRVIVQDADDETRYHPIVDMFVLYTFHRNSLQDVTRAGLPHQRRAAK